MEINFLKMQGSGNDYIFIDCFKNPKPEEEYLPELAKRINNRHIGVGGNGLVLILPGDEHKLKMRIFNVQGLEIDMCGNAIRCVGRYAFDSGIMLEEKFIIETKIGNMGLQIIDSYNLRVNICAPYIIDNSQEIVERLDIKYTGSIMIDDKEYTFTPLFLVSPHAVLFVTDYNFPIHTIGRKIEKHPRFPIKINVEFVRVFSREEIQIRGWKRGVGETYSCSIGASAAVVAAVLNGFTEREVVVHVKGGDLYIEWNEDTNHVFISGPAQYVFSGTYYFDEPRLANCE